MSKTRSKSNINRKLNKSHANKSESIFSNSIYTWRKCYFSLNSIVFDWEWHAIKFRSRSHFAQHNQIESESILFSLFVCVTFRSRQIWYAENGFRQMFSEKKKQLNCLFVLQKSIWESNRKKKNVGEVKMEFYSFHLALH